MKFHPFFFTLVCLFIPLSSWSGETEKREVVRRDGSLLTIYIDLPENSTSFPIALLIEGSQCESVFSMHQTFKSKICHTGSAMISLEKQGILGPELIHQYEYDLTNSLDHRVEDHLYLIELLREGLLPGWNGQIIIVGGSEGGAVGVLVTTRTPEVIATVIFASGGGLPPRDELRLAVRHYMSNAGQSEEEIEQFLAFAEVQLYEMANDPTPDKHCFGYTYKWWESHIRERNFKEEFLSIECPVYYVHGTADFVIPVESGDILADSFAALGKSNFKYVRMEGYGHNVLELPEFATNDAIIWLTGQLLEQYAEYTPEVGTPI